MMIIPNMWENKSYVPKQQPVSYCVGVIYDLYTDLLGYNEV